MPQFDTTNFLPQLFWLAIAFTILYGIVRLTLPKIGRVVDERTRVIGEDLRVAEVARGDAASAGSAYEAELAKARSEAMHVVAGAKQAAAGDTETRLAAINAEMAERLGAAEARIAAARGEAVKQLDGVAADVAADIVERLTGSRPSDADTRAAVAAIAG